MMRMQGQVKWFNNAKGFGFIQSEQFDEDLFVHYSYIDAEGYKSLKAGQSVSFDLLDRGDGKHATSVRVEGEAEAVQEPEPA